MSDQDSNIFDSSKTSETTEDNSSASNDPATLLASIKAEDGRQKYATVEEAIKALQHSQSHIATIQQENATLKSEVASRKAVEEVLAQLKATNQEPDETPDPGVDSPKPVSVDTIEKLVEQKLQSLDNQKSAKQNTESVIRAMTAKFGDQAEATFVKTAKDSGVSIEYLNSLAATAPQAVLRLAGIEPNAAPRAPSSSSGSVNPEALKPTEHVPSAKLKLGATTKDMVEAWRASRPAEAS